MRGTWLRLPLVLSLLAAPLDAQQATVPKLISPEDLTLLYGQKTPTLVDVRPAWTSYLQNHLPGAVWLNIETLRAGNGELPFQLLPVAHYLTLFQRLRAGQDRPVVIYSAGDQSDADATFVAWLMSTAGLPDVRVLDGGYARWELHGRPVTQAYPRLPAAARIDARLWLPTVATLKQVQLASAGRTGELLVDARSPEQFSGAAGAQMRRGRIPGAVNHYWKDDLETRDLALVWKSAGDLGIEYAAQGITPDRDIIVYCNTGTEASHVFFALKYILAYRQVRIYVGSWSEWASRMDLPIARDSTAGAQ